MHFILYGHLQLYILHICIYVYIWSILFYLFSFVHWHVECGGRMVVVVKCSRPEFVEVIKRIKKHTHIELPLMCSFFSEPKLRLSIRFSLRWSPIYIIAKLFVRKSHDSGHVIYLFHIIFFNEFSDVGPIHFFFCSFTTMEISHFIIVLEAFLSLALSSLFAFL